MFVQAHIFASWYNGLKFAQGGKLFGCAAPAHSRGCAIRRLSENALAGVVIPNREHEAVL